MNHIFIFEICADLEIIKSHVNQVTYVSICKKSVIYLLSICM